MGPWTWITIHRQGILCLSICLCFMWISVIKKGDYYYLNEGKKLLLFTEPHFSCALPPCDSVAAMCTEKCRIAQASRFHFWYKISPELENCGEPRNQVPEQAFYNWGRFGMDFTHQSCKCNCRRFIILGYKTSSLYEPTGPYERFLSYEATSSNIWKAHFIRIKRKVVVFFFYSGLATVL